MANKRIVFFVMLSSNVPFVMKEALNMVTQKEEVAIFFDLDGARALDRRYLNSMNYIHGRELSRLFQSALNKGIKLYGCQMNVLIAEGLDLIEGAELAGVVTFLEMAYQADAVLSY